MPCCRGIDSRQSPELLSLSTIIGSAASPLTTRLTGREWDYGKSLRRCTQKLVSTDNCQTAVILVSQW